MTETTHKTTPQPTTDIETNKTPTPPASPLYHFIRENCRNCPFTTNSLDKCDSEQQMKCILARISLDLHTLTRNNTIRGRHINW